MVLIDLTRPPPAERARHARPEDQRESGVPAGPGSGRDPTARSCSACPIGCRWPRPGRSPGSSRRCGPGVGGPGRRRAGRRHHADRAAGHRRPGRDRGPQRCGGRGPPRDRLRVPIGIDADGQPVELDIKESAQGGMGPHGLVVGATGSGKSELLRTLVLGLALTHSPEVLNFVLVDFKGGATFLGLDKLPHVSAVITNLEQELPLVDRMQDALSRRARPPPGAAARRGQLRLPARLRQGPGATAPGSPRCPRCSWSSTSSPSCCRPSRSSSTCSS